MLPDRFFLLKLRDSNIYCLEGELVSNFSSSFDFLIYRTAELHTVVPIVLHFALLFSVF